MSPSTNNAPSMAPTDIRNPDAKQLVDGAGHLNKKADLEKGRVANQGHSSKSTH